MKPRRLLAAAPRIFQHGKSAPPHGHRRYIGPPHRHTCTTPDAAEQVTRERLREALYLACDRAPEFGPEHRNAMETLP